MGQSTTTECCTQEPSPVVGTVAGDSERGGGGALAGVKCEDTIISFLSDS